MELPHGSPCSHVPEPWEQGQQGSRALPGAATTPAPRSGDGMGREKQKEKEIKKERKG